jgi:hypothetical protein
VAELPVNDETKTKHALIEELRATRSRLAAAEEASAQRASVDESQRM